MATIRPYQNSKDRSSVLELLKGFQDHLASVDQSGEVRSFASESDAAHYLDRMMRDVEEMNGAFLVAELHNQIIGFIQGIIDPKGDSGDVMYHTTHRPQIEGWIGLVYVAPELRGQRIGLKLIEAIRTYFIEKGCTRLRLMVASNNTKTVEFYRKYGFKERDIQMTLAL